MNTVGFVGTIEVETRDVSRLWFALTADPAADNWIKIGPLRAWFTMNLEAADRPFYLAQMTLITEAMRSGLQIKVSHGGAASFQKSAPGDSFEVDGVRVLRSPMRF
ncbi:hypothetical protein KOI35_22970 [Actinoplanes bogorensis]|uniref:Uncharacterized protein n=1 Tax=Paractinoplanes bogorensis TaxID=1610840 RepID=A0ABS5YSD6_9ACTN|nr:hypothetical protein [Actinoplanes bogorensis]MBU2666370.1 hypothetical protein [Actinoplanes bogorensis]